MDWLALLIYALILLYLGTILTAAYNIILENRNPVKTVAWVVVILLLPPIGFLFFLYFGVNYRKNKMFSRKELGDIKWLQYMSEDQKQRLKKSEILKREDRKEWQKLMTLLLSNSKALLTRYNKAEILNDGKETFPAIFNAIAKARKFIHLEYYIVEKGELASRLKELLTAKARAGIEVRFIYDDVGCWSLSKQYIREMRGAGVQMVPFLPVIFQRLADKANYRNHRKIVVIDGEVGFVGGLNFADRYLNGIPKIGCWRDTHLCVRGEVVTSLNTVFGIDWYFVRQELLLNREEYLPHKEEDGNTLIQTVASGPDSDWSSIQQAYFTLINMAKKYVFISTPYFMPGETTVNCLKAAAMGGVDVRLMLPHNSDSRLTHWCSCSYVEELLEAGVKVYWYQKGLNHSKVIVVDGIVASVGTANMDMRSFEENFEVNLILYDRAVSKSLASFFMEDLKNSREESINHWKFRPKRQRVKESLARLFAPLL